MLASYGAAVTYGVDVISYIFVLAALLWWGRPRESDDQLAERFPDAFRAGLRYTKDNRELHVKLLRAAIFFAFASSVWALLPHVARILLGGSSGFYGVLLGAVGIGGICGALVMPRLCARLDADGLMLCASIVTALVVGALAFAPPDWLSVLILLLLGAAWIAALTTLNGGAQAILPNWVRGRSLAVYLTVFNGAMTAGSLFWGLVAETIGVPWALAAGGAGLLVTAAVTYPVKIPKGDQDLVPSNHWPEPLTSVPLENDRGPVLIEIEYRTDPADRNAFLSVVTDLSRERQRDRAYAWGITEDVADESVMLEWFMVESWAEHLRQHRRVSKADADVQQGGLSFHKGHVPPVVRHFINVAARKEG